MLEFINKSKRILINNQLFQIGVIEELCERGTIKETRSQINSNMNDGYNTENTEDSFVLPSVASMKDEETMRRIEDNYWQLLQEEEKLQKV